MRILFVCKHNRFRSKVAEAIFKKLNKNNNIFVESAGTIGSINPTNPNVIYIMKEKNYSIEGLPKKIDSLNDVKDYDLIVIVADDVDRGFFNGKSKGRIIQWHISDCEESDVNKIRETVNMIELKVKKLINSIV